MGSKKILFICTGNTCRSVMAEFLARRMAGGSKELEFSSAGVAANSFFPIPSMVAQMLQEEGVKNFQHTPRPLTEAMLREADRIYAMEEHHKMSALRILPGAEGKILLLNEAGIADPIGGSEEVYRKCLNEIREALKKIFDPSGGAA